MGEDRMSESQFRNRGLKVVVDTTEQCEFDFVSHQIAPEQQERIAGNLKALPNSPRDRYFGDVRVREVLDGWDVAFVIGHDANDWVILMIGLEAAGEMEKHLDVLIRAGSKTLPQGVQELLKGRRPSK